MTFNRTSNFLHELCIYILCNCKRYIFSLQKNIKECVCSVWYAAVNDCCLTRRMSNILIASELLLYKLRYIFFNKIHKRQQQVQAMLKYTHQWNRILFVCLGFTWLWQFAKRIKYKLWQMYPKFYKFIFKCSMFIVLNIFWWNMKTNFIPFSFGKTLLFGHQSFSQLSIVCINACRCEYQYGYTG